MKDCLLGVHRTKNNNGGKGNYKGRSKRREDQTQDRSMATTIRMAMKTKIEATT